MNDLVKARMCASWLCACLRIGWKKSDLDFLQELWWSMGAWMFVPAGHDYVASLVGVEL